MTEYKKIVGSEANTGVSGDMVIASQVMSQEAKNVNKSWWDKCLTYEQVRANLEEGIADREDIEVKLSDCTAILNDNGQLIICTPDGQEFTATEHALNQLGFRIGVMQTTLKNFREAPFVKDGPAILKGIINTGIRLSKENEGDKKHLFRTYADGTLRAVLTESFAPIDNRFVLDMIEPLLPGARFSHWKGDADSIIGNILIPDSIRADDDSDYGGMINIANSEIGIRRLKSLPGLFRAICMNGCIHQLTNGEAFSKVHRGTIDYEALKKSFVANIHEQIPLATECIERTLALKCKDYSIGDTERIVAKLMALTVKEHKISPKLAHDSVKEFSKHESSQRNLFGVIQGLTRATQLQSSSEWLAGDIVAGKLASYDVDEFVSYRKRAEKLKDADLIKLLGLKKAAV